MNDGETLSHTQWECKYHVAFMPKYGRKVLDGLPRRYPGDLFRQLAPQRESRV